MAGKFDINPATGKQYGINPATGVQDDNYWAQVVEPKLKSGGSFGGPSGSGAFDPSSFLAESKRQQEDLFNRQRAEEEALFRTFEERHKAQPGLTSVYDKLIAEQGLPEKQQAASAVRGEIFKVKDLLDQLESDVTSRVSGTLTSEAQRRRQIAAEREPLSANLGRLATGLEPLNQDIATSMGMVSTKLGLTQKDQERELDPIRMRISATSDRFAREMTGYNQTKQNELTLLLNKMEEQQQLDQREWQRVQQLASEEREWQRTKEKMDIEQQNAIKLKQTREPVVQNPFLMGGMNSGQQTTLGTKTSRTYDDWLNLDNQGPTLNLNAAKKSGGLRF